MFCRESASEVARLRPQILGLGTQVAFVHMSSELRADEFFAEFKMPDVPRISDPNRKLYAAFDLKQGRFLQFAGLKTVVGSARAFLAGHRQGKTEGDVLQMPGAFLLHRGRVVRSFYHESPADRPDYLGMAILPEESEP
ncbi:MAG TPA: peroxiredoxin-like family protein [Fimbriimonadaceae bacterium]|nr:peroxiredoxin-like family protein [Fimbriimonadaceae bacterium]